MGVLAAVLAYPGRITLDVTRIQRGLVKWRREQQRQAVVAPDQFPLDRAHCFRRPIARRRARERRPGLRDRVDAALLACRRAQRLAVVEKGAPIPFSVPRFIFERGLAERQLVRSISWL